MLGSRFLSYEPAARHGRLYRALEGGLQRRQPEPTTSRCKASCATPSLTVLFALAMLGGTVYLFLTMPTGFIPSQDTRLHLRASTLASQDISFESMAKHLRAVGDILEHDPNVRAMAPSPATATRVSSSP